MKTIAAVSLCALLLGASTSWAGPHRPTYMASPSQQATAVRENAQITELRTQNETLKSVLAAQQQQVEALTVLQQQMATQIELQKQTIQFLSASYQLQQSQSRTPSRAIR